MKKSNSTIISIPIVRVTGNYQVTIPVEIRKALHVEVGDYIEMSLGQQGLALLKPVEVIKKTRKKSKKGNGEMKDWVRGGESELLNHYDEKDAAYDHIKL